MADFASASLIENVRLNQAVIVPNALQGLFKRRRRAVDAATRVNVDGQAIGLLQGLRLPWRFERKKDKTKNNQSYTVAEIKACASMAGVRGVVIYIHPCANINGTGHAMALASIPGRETGAVSSRWSQLVPLLRAPAAKITLPLSGESARPIARGGIHGPGRGVRHLPHAGAGLCNAPARDGGVLL